MSKLIFLTGCPANCDDVNLLPAIPEEQDCTSYEILLSQISDLYIMPDGATNPLTSWATTPTATAGAIDNTITDNSKCKWIAGEGLITVTETVTEYPHRKRKITERAFRLEFIVKDMANHYEFLRQLQCGSTSYSAWYGDLADYIYGKASGIQPELVNVLMLTLGGRDDKQQATIIWEWTADGNPERRVNPLS